MDKQKIWTDMRISMKLKKKRGGLNEWKIWTDIRISMNLKKKKIGFWTNGRLQKKTKQNKTKKKKLSPDLSESLTRFTTKAICKAFSEFARVMVCTVQWSLRVNVVPSPPSLRVAQSPSTKPPMRIWCRIIFWICGTSGTRPPLRFPPTY